MKPKPPLEYEVTYPHFVPRRFALAKHRMYEGADRVSLICPESYFIGHILGKEPDDIRADFRAWKEYRLENNEHFALLKDTYMVDTQRYQRIDGSKKRFVEKRKRDLVSLTDPQLAFALERAIHSREGTYHFFRKGGKEAFGSTLEFGISADAGYAGGISLSSKVKSKSSAIPSDSKSFKNSAIKGYLESNRIYYSDMDCDCTDFFEMKKKQGHTDLQHTCVHIGALLTFAYENPKLVKNFNNLAKDAKIFMPFHPEKVPELRIDVLVDRYFNHASYFSLGKKLSKIQAIHSPLMIDLMNKGEFRREVAVNEYIFKSSNPMSTHVRNLFKQCQQFLSRSGFALSGYCLESMDSAWETIAMDFKKDSISARLLFNNLFPPVLVMRRENPGAKIEPFRVNDAYPHPFSELFMPKDERFDPTQMRETQYEVRLPTEFEIPASLRNDYAATIAAFFPDGIEGFKRQIDRRGVKNKEKLLRLVTR